MASPNKKTAILSLLLALGVCTNILELFVPSVPFLPWLKPGLANAFTLSAITLTGPLGGLCVALLRSLISGALSGLPATSILIGGSGGIISALGMGLLFRLSGKRELFSPIGIAVAGAFLHNLAQLTVVYLLFVRNPYIFWQIPVLGPVAVLTGIITGLLSFRVTGFIARNENLIAERTVPVVPTASAGPAFLKLLLLAGAGTIIFMVRALWTQAMLFPAVILVLFVTGKKSRLILLARFFPLLLLTLILNALTVPGHFIRELPFVTVEGLITGALYALRTLNLIAASMSLFSQKDLIALLSALGRRFTGAAFLADVGIRAMALIPSVAAVLKDFYLKAPAQGVFQRLKYLREGLGNAMEDVMGKL